MFSISMSKWLTRRVRLVPILAFLVGLSLLYAFPKVGANTSLTAIGETIQATLDDTDSQLSAGQFFDEYTFEGTQGQEILINLSSFEFDAFLWLLNSEGKVLAIDDDTGDAMGAVTSNFFLPNTETYTIVVSSHDAEETGAYTLSLNQAPWSDYSGNHPKEIFIGKTKIGRLAKNDSKFSTGQFYDAYTFSE